MIRKSVVVIFLALMVVLNATAFGEEPQVTGTTLCVKPGGGGGCYSTIQSAINAASPGDVIEVAAGIYPEHITMRDGISVHGQGWDSITGTVIDGQHSAAQHVVDFSGVSASTVLSGVQLYRGGAGDLSTSIYSNLHGGGIYIYGDSPKIINTWVNSCTAKYGGGVYVNTETSATPTFDNVPVWNCKAESGGGFSLVGGSGGGGEVTITANPLMPTDGTVWWNSAEKNGGGFAIGRDVTVSLTGLRVWGNTADECGGGAYISPSTKRITFLLNWFSGNTATAAGAFSHGAGIYAFQANDLQMLGNTISSNTASGGADGGGVYFSDCAGLINGNWFLDNMAGTDEGGGAKISGSSTGLTLISNRFEGNSAWDGGGLSLTSGAVPKINANTIVSNTAAHGGGMWLLGAGAAQVTNNILAQNTATNGRGGGMAVVQSPASQVINNTIADNTGDGVIFTSSEGVAIVNNIISNNSGDGIERDASGPTTLYTADYNDVWMNSSNYNGLLAGLNDESQDPKYVGTGNLFEHYHIQGTSPVKETGSTAWAPDFDIDWDARFFGAGVSMGADEIPVMVSMYENSLPLAMKSY